MLVLFFAKRMVRGTIHHFDTVHHKDGLQNIGPFKDVVFRQYIVGLKQLG